MTLWGAYLRVTPFAAGMVYSLLYPSVLGLGALLIGGVISIFLVLPKN